MRCRAWMCCRSAICARPQATSNIRLASGPKRPATTARASKSFQPDDAFCAGPASRDRMDDRELVDAVVERGLVLQIEHALSGPRAKDGCRSEDRLRQLDRDDPAGRTIPLVVDGLGSVEHDADRRSDSDDEDRRVEHGGVDPGRRAIDIGSADRGRPEPSPLEPADEPVDPIDDVGLVNHHDVELRGSVHAFLDLPQTRWRP